MRESGGMRPQAIHHVSINVTDTKDAMRFYVDVLGLTERGDRPDFGIGSPPRSFTARIRRREGENRFIADALVCGCRVSTVLFDAQESTPFLEGSDGCASTPGERVEDEPVWRCDQADQVAQQRAWLDGGMRVALPTFGA